MSFYLKMDQFCAFLIHGGFIFVKLPSSLEKQIQNPVTSSQYQVYGPSGRNSTAHMRWAAQPGSNTVDFFVSSSHWFEQPPSFHLVSSFFYINLQVYARPIWLAAGCSFIHCMVLISIFWQGIRLKMSNQVFVSAATAGADVMGIKRGHVDHTCKTSYVTKGHAKT